MINTLKISKNLLINFINKNEDWFNILSDEEGGYALKIKRSTTKGEENLWMFSYNQILTNWKYPESYYARGTILEIIDNKVTRVVRHAFDKFFNAQEGYADKIHWDANTYTTMKMDGSIIELYHYNDKWHWSTSGMFHAEDANLSEVPAVINDGAENSKTFMDLINFCIAKQKIDLSIFNPDHTYSFELTSPRNRVVTPYEETFLTFIGERDNITDEETPIEESPIAKHLPLPKRFEFISTNEAIEAADKLTNLVEGFVVRGTKRPDGSFNRVKIKSREYIKCHHIRGENNFSHKQLFEVVQANESGEIEAYFPEVKEKIGTAFETFNSLIEKVSDAIKGAIEKRDQLIAEDPLYAYSNVNVKKKFSTWVNTQPQAFRSFLYFAFKDDPIKYIKEYFREVSWRDYKDLQKRINLIDLTDGEK